MNTELASGSLHLKPVVTFTGTVAECKVGPSVGAVDIGASEDAYFFRVALPGVRSKKCNLRCHIQVDGKVHIEGVIDGYWNDEELKNQQLCPPGPFKVCFNLPGPVDPRLCSPYFRSDGILEVVVLKYRIPVIATDWIPSR